MPPLVLFAGGQGEGLLSTGLRGPGAGVCAGVWGGGSDFGAAGFRGFIFRGG